MSAPAQPKSYYDLISSFEAGVNGGIEPLLLPKNQLARGENISVRGAYVSHRPPILNRGFIWPDPVTQANVENGLFQGAGYYRPDFGTEQLIAQISGRLFSFTEVGDKFIVKDISVPGDLNAPGQLQVWMWQSEKWMIISDGSGALPIFYDGVVSRRSFGPSTVLGIVNAVVSPVAPPAIGGATIVTMNAVYNGPFNVPVIFNGAFYQPVGAAGTANAQLTNINDVPGNTVPSGTQIIVNPNFVGYTSGASSSTSVFAGLACVTPSFCDTDYIIKFVLTLQSLGTIAAGDGITVTTNIGLEAFNVDSVDSVNKKITISQHTTVHVAPCPTCAAGPAPATKTISDATLVQFSSSRGPNVLVGTTVANYTVPAVGAVVNVELDIPYSGPANIVASAGGFQYNINSLAAGPGINVTLINLSDTSTANYGTAPHTLPENMLSVPELPAGRMGAYGMGRNWMSLIDGISFIGGDIVGGPAGTVANNFRDSVLKTTENTFLAGGGNFSLPGAGDIITAMIFPTVLDASLGQGSLQVGTANSMFSCNTPVDRTTWATLTNPILTQSLTGKGPLGQNSTKCANSDVIFREFDGLGTLIQARRSFTNSADSGGGNTPISREMSYVFDLDNQTLLSYSNSMTFDNRYLETAIPSISPSGIVHDELVSMNFDTVSNLRTKIPPLYEGSWVGLDVLQTVFGQVNGTKRGFAFAINNTTGKIELHEFLSSQNTITMDAGSIPISWLFETPVAFNKDVKPLNDLIRLTDGEIYTKDIVGTVQIEVQYRPDFIQTWTSWRKFTVDQTTWKPRMGLGMPSSKDCDTETDRQMRVGYFFQFRVIITGHIKWMAFRVMATEEPQTPFAKPVCPVIPTPTPQIPDVSGGNSSDCVNIIPSGAIYLSDNENQFFVTGLQVGANYKITFGVNDLDIDIGGGNLITTPGVGQSANFVATQINVRLDGNCQNDCPVTAILCKVV